MGDWAKRVDAFLQFSKYEILNDAGKVTSEIAKAFAESEFEKYRMIQGKLFQSDFDKLIDGINDEEMFLFAADSLIREEQILLYGKEQS